MVTLVLVVLCTCEAIGLVFAMNWVREEQRERRFWYESSCRAWDSLIGTLEAEDDL